MSTEQPRKVSADLRSAIEDDALHKARDAAKFKAVGQRVDYETFKNMVAVAHLKPLQAPGSGCDARLALPAWQFGLDGAPVGAGASGKRSAWEAPSDPPATGADFERAWRRADSQQRLAYLHRVPASSFATLFRVEVNPAILAEIIATYAADWRSYGDTEGAAAATVLQALAGIARAGRFSLTASLLSGASKAAAATLFQQLAVVAAQGSSTDDGAASEGMTVFSGAMTGSEHFIV